ncbi:MAG: family 49 glycosyl hydrolase, partial [Proteobacteria bacterium]|nr:family 49 glycosyl hydrolase [Pseudomonadota bacterium]
NLEALTTWTHPDAFLSDTGPTPAAKVRGSVSYRTRVALAQQPCHFYDAFTYLSVPRGGHDKRGYTAADGAEFSAAAGLTMSWAQFLYREDAVVQIDVLDPSITLTSPDQVVIRPIALGLKAKILGPKTIEIAVPFRPEGFRLSVDFKDDLYTTYSSIDTLEPTPWQGDLTLTRTVNPVHTEPRHGMLLFAEPMLTAAETVELVPESQGPQSRVFYPEPGDLSHLADVDTEILYFKPGLYWLPYNLHARLSPAVRWVYLAPGAFVQGAIEFGAGLTDVKLTGFGVLSGDDYIYEALVGGTPPYSRRPSSGGKQVVRMVNLNSGNQHQLLTVHGVTVTGLPFWALGYTGNQETLAISIDHLKQVGGWYYQTDGFEPKRGNLTLQDPRFAGQGRLRHSFIHNNDDSIKMYDSELTVEDVVVWKGENGPVIQFGWWPRTIKNSRAQGVTVIHNRLHWNCVIDSENNHNAYHREHGLAADPSQNLTDLTFEDITVEGSVKCAVAINLLSNLHRMTVRNLAIDAWNGLHYKHQASYLKPIRNAADPQVVVDRNVSASAFGLKIENYTVGGQRVSFEKDNWRDFQLGRLDIDGSQWGRWSVH